MNKTYRSIWNASLGCYVAAPESAVGHSAGTSCKRVVRANPLMRSKSMMALESRVLFDGAMLATAIEPSSAPLPPEIPDVSTPAVAVEAPTAQPTTASPVTEVVSPEPVTTVPQIGATTTAETPITSTASGETVTAPVSTALPTTETTIETVSDTTPLAVEPPTVTRQEIVFIDARVSDPAAFQGQDREVIVLNMEQDGLAQIASALNGRTGVDAIHIVSHGSDGLFTLGSTEVTAASIQTTQLAYLQGIGQALSADGDILIYACDYASGASGLEAMNLLADITGADVAASVDATGHELLGADWALEQSTGAIEVQALAPLAWMNALDFTFTGAGTVGALGMANNIMGAGVTVVSATYQGGATQSGTFAAGSGVTFGSNVLGFTSGTILSTGSNAAGVAGPNSNPAFGDNAPGVDGDPTLDAMAGFPTLDAAILNISFIPDVPPGGNVGDVGRMTLEIVFGSDEYLEYVNQVNDVMEVTVNGQVVSLVPNASGGESTIGINSVNTTQNPSLFIDNAGGTYNTQMDAFTVTIPMVFDIIVGQTNTIRLAVADAVDDVLDSWLFIRADSGQTVVVAEDDQVTTAANLPITVDLTANDYSLAGGSMTLTQIQGQAVSQGQVITLASGIQLTVGAGGQVTVTGNGSSAANDTFTYQVSNGMGGIASATVNVEVTAPNLNPPVAQDDIETVLANATLSDSVLTNNGNGADTDPNGDPLSVVQVNLTGFTPGDPITLASGALLTMNANGTYVYNPNGAFDGLADGATTTDSFSYTVTDGQGGNDTAQVSVTITGVNNAPIAVSDSFVVSEEGAHLLGSLLANDSDVDADALWFVLDGYVGSNGGSMSQDDSGGLYFIAGASFDDLAVGQTRDTTFNYTLYDALGASATATVTITVEGANDAPVVADDVYDVTEEGAHFMGNPLANDSDPEGDNLHLTFSTWMGSSGGSFGMDDSGHLIFIAGNDFDDLNVGESRQTSLVYAVHDNNGAQTASTVTVTVHGTNDAPVSGNDDFIVYEDNAVVLGGLTDNDFDLDGGSISVDTSSGSAGDNGGLFSFDDSGNLIFNPNDDFNHLGEGESRFTRFNYTLYDGQGGSAMATVVVEVLGLNDAPVAMDDQFVGFEDTPIALGSLLANDSDVEGQAMAVDVSSAIGSGGGQFLLDDSFTLTFNPVGAFDDLAPGESRDTSFSYTLTDSQGGSSQAVVTVTVMGSNDDPVAQDDHYDVGNHAAIFLDSPLANDSDIEGDALTLSQMGATAGTNGGLLSVDGAGNLNFDPAGDFDDLAIGDTRNTSFTYSVLDGQGGIAEATVTVTVHGVEDNDPGQQEMMGAQSYPNEVVFVDSRIPDPQSFAIAGRELVVLTLDADGLTQMAAALNGRTGIEAIHVVSHGGEGYLTLGSGNIDASSFQSGLNPALLTLSTALVADGDILIYACDFAAGVDGQNTMQLLAQYTLADVAASLDTTGDSSLGGNWSLEVAVGSIEAVVLTPAGWVHTLNLNTGAFAAPATVEPVQQDTQVVPMIAVAQAPAHQALGSTELPVTVSSATLSLSPVMVTEVPVAQPVAIGATSVLPQTDAPAFAVAGASRLVSLEEVFRQTLTPFMTSASGLQVDTVGTLDLSWSQHSVAIDSVAATHHDSAAGWLPTVEALDDSSVDEALANADRHEAKDADVDALQQPRTQAAPGFAAQLTRWSQWTAQRPLTRASVRA